MLPLMLALMVDVDAVGARPLRVDLRPLEASVEAKPVVARRSSAPVGLGGSGHSRHLPRVDHHGRRRPLVLLVVRVRVGALPQEVVQAELQQLPVGDVGGLHALALAVAPRVAAHQRVVRAYTPVDATAVLVPLVARLELGHVEVAAAHHRRLEALAQQPQQRRQHLLRAARPQVRLAVRQVHRHTHDVDTRGRRVDKAEGGVGGAAGAPLAVVRPAVARAVRPLSKLAPARAFGEEGVGRGAQHEAVGEERLQDVRVVADWAAPLGLHRPQAPANGVVQLLQLLRVQLLVEYHVWPHGAPLRGHRLHTRLPLLSAGVRFHAGQDLLAILDCVPRDPWRHVGRANPDALRTHLVPLDRL
mmetsp:Transcript_18355/g.53092  ORF Transcript_18355/g.53092 Transcript_18355/m.53092 type:complete len:359 (-) Transcript_18355:368-1444(-)